MRFLRSTAVCAALLVLVLLAWASWVLLPVLADPAPGFAARKGTLLEVRETGFYEQADSELTELTLRSSSGLQVQLALRRPRRPLPGNPTLVLIAGQQTGRDAAMMFPDTHGITVAALSYLYNGSREFSRLGLALDLHKVQRAILDTAPAVMLTNDYLLDHSVLKPASLELVGVSFGAFLAAVPAVLDERINRVWLIHGAGEPARVIDRGLEGNIRPAPLRALAARFLAAAAAAPHLAPEYWVGRISPRPVMVINGRDDDDLTPESVRVLHAALAEPHEIMWVEGGHIQPKRPETITRVIDLMFARMVSDLVR